MKNPFKGRAPLLSGPTEDLCPVTPDDVSDLPKIAVALYVTTGGTVVFKSVADAIRTVDVADYSILPVGVVQVLASGTSATGIHAFVVS
ncbi:spike base protein, RCAP_Rcc01079 family [Tritonibacter mobilis]|uniref:spike base protein, RCAP_Rcc01079 family n=1 Tax=Tritonibacter mobilis TaxID=379347 RepID=UPI001C083666|nr:hypothetical protein [Tritonibacter mobilis]MBU3036018.1 hypothetical protein [Tritonibacter mobilis]WHQ85266.1 hypothetical protein OMR53_21590 [Tritonibacter mobilis]